MSQLAKWGNNGGEVWDVSRTVVGEAKKAGDLFPVFWRNCIVDGAHFLEVRCDSIFREDVAKKFNRTLVEFALFFVKSDVFVTQSLKNSREAFIVLLCSHTMDENVIRYVQCTWNVVKDFSDSILKYFSGGTDAKT